MSRFWSLDDPRHPSTQDGEALAGSSHPGVISSTSMVGPDALYAGLVEGYVPSERMEIGVDSYLPGGSSPRHAHADREKLFVVLAGRARITIGDDARKLGPGGTAFVPVGVAHHFENVGEDVLHLLAAFAHLEAPRSRD